MTSSRSEGRRRPTVPPAQKRSDSSNGPRRWLAKGSAWGNRTPRWWTADPDDHPSVISVRSAKLQWRLTSQIADLQKQPGLPHPTHQQIATMLGVSRPYVTNVLAGKAALTIDFLVGVAAAVGAKLRIELITPEQEEKEREEAEIIKWALEMKAKEALDAQDSMTGSSVSAGSHSSTSAQPSS